MTILNIQIKKNTTGKGFSFRMTRSNGTETWMKYKNGTPYHDLSHFVVEQYFCIKFGFYGEILHGADFEKFTANALISTQSWQKDIFLAEALANFFQFALYNSLTLKQALTYHDSVQQNYENKIDLPTILDPEFQKISTSIQKLWTEYNQLSTGESMHLVFNLNENRI